MPRKHGSHIEVISAFVEDEEYPYEGSNVFFRDNVLYSYGFHFPLAIKGIDGMIIVNGDKTSVSTSKHQSILQRALYHKNNYSTTLFSSRKGNFGILVHDDYWALNYQIYHYRAKRAKHALLGSGTRWFEFHNGNWNNEESAKKKGEEIDRQLLRVDWERYMYAKKKIIEDFSHMWEE
jgi:hypothetical protein